jgi:hypothetical protein
VKLLHRPADGTERELAAQVEVADSLFAKGLGLMFRRSVPADYALAFPFSAVKPRRLHMLFVPFDVDAVWVVEGEVRRVERLAAWRGRESAAADLVVELPAGSAKGVTPGDRIRLQRDGTDAQSP